MPVNLIDIQKSLPDFAEQAKYRGAEIVEREKTLLELVSAYADQLDIIKRRIVRAVELDPKLRCALPVSEPLNEVVPAPKLPGSVTVMASDGSQINPTRHTRIPFCVINISFIKMVRGSALPTQVITRSELLDYDEVVLSSGGILSEARVALLRDLKERKALLELAGDFEAPAVAMVDGPLELIREVRAVVDYEKVLAEYKQVLQSYYEQKLILLGYIDKPQSDLIGRMMDVIGRTEDEESRTNSKSRQFGGVIDRQWLKRFLVNPGDRSAIFMIQSETAQSLDRDLAFHFFYINVGKPGKPHLARVEIPAWVAGDHEKVGWLQAVLTDQAQATGPRPYPYLLHRAHEEAVIPISEHQRIEDMVVTEMRKLGMEVADESNKSFLKTHGK